MFFRNVYFLILPILIGFTGVQGAGVVGRRGSSTDGPIVNLGAAGTYKGILQNNGTVES